MAKLTEISPAAKQEDYVTTDDEHNFTDAETDVSDDEQLIKNETVYDRIVALRDIFPEHSRERALKKFGVYASTAMTVGKVVGQIAWVLTTSALVLVMPLLFEMEKDQAVDAWEQEQLMQQQGAQKVLQQQPAIPGMPIPAGLQKVPNRACIEITGPDNVTLLQGLITNNLESFCNRNPVHGSMYSVFLNNSGRVLLDTIIYPIFRDFNTDLVLEVDSRLVDSLLAHIKKYKLRSRVETRLLHEHGVFCSWLPKQTHEMAHDVDDDLKTSAEAWSPDPRVSSFGQRYVVPLNRKLDNLQPAEDYITRRCTFGIAEGMDDFEPNVLIPQEANVDFMNGIDYRKGCYLGQELTIRTHHRGVVRKRLVPLRFTTPVSPQVKCDLSNVSSNKPLGKIISVFGNVGLGLCRLEAFSSSNSSVDLQGTVDGRQISCIATLPDWWPK